MILFQPTLIGLLLTLANLWLLIGASEQQRWIWGGLLSLCFVPIVQTLHKRTRARTMKLLAENGETLDRILAQIATDPPAPQDTPKAR